jgi:hypothetical protein
MISQKQWVLPWVCSVVFLVILTGLGPGGTGPARAVAAGRPVCGSWQVVPSPNAGATSSLLSAVAALTATDVWAVGAAGSYPHFQTLIEHWNGTRWQVVPSRHQGALGGVTAVAADNVWAVGDLATGSSGQASFIEHWNGRQWQVVPNPNPGTYNDLAGVVALAANDVWAVESFASASIGPTQTLIEHWNGRSWQVVPSPNPGTDTDELDGLAQVPGATQFWAVGSYGNSLSTPARTLVEFYC